MADNTYAVRPCVIPNVIFVSAPCLPMRNWLALERSSDLDFRITYEQELSDEQRTPANSKVDEHWDQIKQATHLVTEVT